MKGLYTMSIILVLIIIITMAGARLVMLWNTKPVKHKREAYMAVPGDTLYVRGDTIIIKPYNYKR